MANDIETFREYLAFYGADTTTWPEHANVFAARVLHMPEYAALLDSEKQFEQLLGSRAASMPSTDFASRIISASRSRNIVTHSAAKLFGIWENAPSAAVAAMLLLGCAVGVGALAPISTSTDAASAQINVDDEGAML